MKMKPNTNLFLALSLLFFCGNLDAQISFTNQNLLLPAMTHSGVGIGVNDMNGDDLDDIIRLNQARELRIVYQGDDGTFTEVFIGDVSSDQWQWTLCTADADNNGFGDVLTGDRDSSRITMASNDGLSYNIENDFPFKFFAQGSNFADINNDGFLDIFICNDDGESYIFGNDGNGGFFDANDWIDMYFEVPNGVGDESSGNYASIWTDFDNDCDLDLYIAHCRQKPTPPNGIDERRINRLYVNDGNNNYTEMAAEYGLNIHWQSWTSDFQDIDNDGDFDCFLTNHDYESQIFENDGTGHFTDITPGMGIEDITGLIIQGLMRDFDNDGFVDILVAGSHDFLYHNNGDKTFTRIEDPFNNNNIKTCAIGDLNNDGFLDIYAGYPVEYTEPSVLNDVLWINEGNDNNWFKVHLVGTVSNLDGVGARIEIYGDWGVQIREVRAGESYGISNSLIQNFGLGTAAEIFHVFVKWPSGIVDLVDGPSINGLTEIIEGDCQPNEIVITADGNTTFCEGESVALTTDVEGTYYWSNGENTQEITVTQSGNYSLIVENADGCFDLSQTIIVTVNPEEIPTIEVTGGLSFCEGGSVTLTASEASAYTWSTGETTQSVEVSADGAYTVTAMGLCEEFTSSPTAVTVVPLAPQAIAEDVNIAAPGDDATLEATGDFLSWYNQPIAGEVLFEGPTWLIPNVMTPATYYVENIVADIDFMEPHDFEGNSSYTGNQFNGQVIFDAINDFVLKSVKVITDTPGERKIVLQTATEEILYVKSADLPVGESRIELDFLIEKGQGLILTTDTLANLGSFGYKAPRLKRSALNVAYPYVLDNIAEITGSNYVDNQYYYFYDWEIKTPAVDCVDERVEVNISIGIDVVDINDTDAINIFPNPGNGLLQIEFNTTLSSETNIRITDVTGRILLQKENGASNGKHVAEVDASHLTPGSYLLQVEVDDKHYFTKLIIQ